MAWEEQFLQVLEKKGTKYSKGMVRHYQRLTKESAMHTCSECELTIGRYPGRPLRYCPNCGVDMFNQDGYPRKELKGIPTWNPDEGPKLNEAKTLRERMAVLESIEALCEEVHAAGNWPMVPWSPNNRILSFSHFNEGAIYFSLYAPFEEAEGKAVRLGYHPSVCSVSEILGDLPGELEHVASELYEKWGSLTRLKPTLEAYGPANWTDRFRRPVTPTVPRGNGQQHTFHKMNGQDEQYGSGHGPSSGTSDDQAYMQGTGYSAHQHKQEKGKKKEGLGSPSGSAQSSATPGLPVGAGGAHSADVTEDPDVRSQKDYNRAFESIVSSPYDLAFESTVDDFGTRTPSYKQAYGNRETKEADIDKKTDHAPAIDVTEATTLTEGLLSTKGQPITDVRLDEYGAIEFMTSDGEKDMWVRPFKPGSNSRMRWHDGPMILEFVDEDGSVGSRWFVNNNLATAKKASAAIEGLIEAADPANIRTEFFRQLEKKEKREKEKSKEQAGDLGGYTGVGPFDENKTWEENFRAVLEKEGSGDIHGGNSDRPDVDATRGSRQYETAVAVVVKDQKEVLIGKVPTTSGDDRAGHWCFPGGGIDEADGHDPVRAAIREAFEEAGIKVTSTGTVLNHKERPGVAFVVCEYVSGDPEPNMEFSQWEWMPYKIRHEHDTLFPINRQVLERIPPGKITEKKDTRGRDITPRAVSGSKVGKKSRELTGGTSAEPDSRAKDGTSMRTPKAQRSVNPDVKHKEQERQASKALSPAGERGKARDDAKRSGDLPSQDAESGPGDDKKNGNGNGKNGGGKTAPKPATAPKATPAPVQQQAQAAQKAPAAAPGGAQQQPQNGQAPSVQVKVNGAGEAPGAQQQGQPGQQQPGQPGQEMMPGQVQPGQEPAGAQMQTAELVLGDKEMAQNAYDWLLALKFQHVTLDGMSVVVGVSTPAEMQMLTRVAGAFKLELSNLVQPQGQPEQANTA